MKPTIQIKAPKLTDSDQKEAVRIHSVLEATTNELESVASTLEGNQAKLCEIETELEEKAAAAATSLVPAIHSRLAILYSLQGTVKGMIEEGEARLQALKEQICPQIAEASVFIEATGAKHVRGELGNLFNAAIAPFYGSLNYSATMPVVQALNETDAIRALRLLTYTGELYSNRSEAGLIGVARKQLDLLLVLREGANNFFEFNGLAPE
jgi:hypothetical protein